MSILSTVHPLRTRRLDEEDSLVLSADVEQKSEIDLISGKGFEQVAALFSTSSVFPFSKPAQKNFIPSVDNPFSKSASAFKAPDFSLTVLYNLLQFPEKKSTPPSAISNFVNSALSAGATGVKNLGNTIQRGTTAFFQPLANQADWLLYHATAEERAAYERDQTHLAINIALGAGGILSTRSKITSRIIQADQRIVSIVREQLKRGIELPVIDRITFDPATLVLKTQKHLDAGLLTFSHLKGDENSLLIFVHFLYNARELARSAGGMTTKSAQSLGAGAVFEASAVLSRFAAQQGANRAFVQFVPGNKHLFHILTKKYPLVGNHPFHLPEFPHALLLKETLSPILEITHAIPKNPTSYLHAIAGAALAIKLDSLESLSNNSLSVSNDNQETKTL